MTIHKRVAMKCAGVDARTVTEISAAKGEPRWMRELRLKSLDVYCSSSVPRWGADLSQLNVDSLDCYATFQPKQVPHFFTDVLVIRSGLAGLQGTPDHRRRRSDVCFRRKRDLDWQIRTANVPPLTD